MRNPMSVKILCVCCTVVFGAAISIGCNRKAGGGREMRAAGPAMVTTQPVRVEPVQRVIDVVGTLYGDEESTIAAKVPGRIVKMSKEAGERVKSGELLCLISAIDYELAVKQKELLALEPLAKLGLKKLPEGELNLDTLATVKKAQIQTDNAYTAYMRLEKMKQENPAGVMEQEYDNAKTAWQVAQNAYEVEKLTAMALLAQARTAAADLQVAQQRLEDTRVYAPPSSAVGPEEAPQVREYGVSARMASIGEFMKEGAPVYQLVDDHVLKLRARVIERYLRDVHDGQRVLVESVAHPGRKFTGTIRYINPQVDSANRTFLIEALVPNPLRADSKTGQRELKAGGFVTAKILIGAKPDAVFVPLESIVTFAGVSKVFTMREGKAVEHVIEQGETRGDWVEATKGLDAGEAVVVRGASKLANGVAVSVLREAPTRPATRPANLADAEVSR